MKSIVRYALKEKGWFDYTKLADHITEEAKNRKHAEGKTDSMGHPSSTHTAIMQLVRYGFLQLDPAKGLKVNKKFVPKNQIKKEFLTL